MINCNDNCEYQCDGCCNLNDVTSISNSEKSVGCVYFRKKARRNSLDSHNEIAGFTNSSDTK